jgi:hypothetical protein
MDSKNISCEFCKKEVPKSSLLLHIGKSYNCKAHYGKRFENLKKKKNKERKKLWRKSHGKEELEKQRDLYKDNPCKKEKKKRARKEKQEKLEKENAKNVSERNLPKEEDDPSVIPCLFCSKRIEYTSLFKHIAHNKLCKDFYGPKFEKMKKRHASLRMRQYREEHGRKSEFQKQCILVRILFNWLS